MEHFNLWSRRKFSKTIVSLQALVASGVLNIPIGCTPNKEPGKHQSLSPVQQEILKLAMDEIIPNWDGMPSASEVGGLEYILDVLKEYPDMTGAFAQLLLKLNEQSKKTRNEDFVNLNDQSRIDELKQFEVSQPELFDVLKNIVYESYYINEKVWELIGYEPYPTLSAGPKMEPFDEKLLERVKQMPPIYFKPKK